MNRTTVMLDADANSEMERPNWQNNKDLEMNNAIANSSK